MFLKTIWSAYREVYPISMLPNTVADSCNFINVEHNTRLLEICQMLEASSEYTAVHPCDVFLPETFYPCFNIIFGIILELYLLIQTAMTFERTIATIYVRSYEHKKVLPAIIIALSTVSIAVGTQLWLYHGKVITHPQVSVLNTPIEIYDRTNCVLIFNVVVCGLTTASMIILVIINKKRQMK
ncbi:hypothetical protein GCK32_014082 [Trichostrongylus colubriformis]|uniref:Uncharacterized protein n=1 Tax=Trichostrongylus colubriformis TaxID=6319 RepID=A0AAN8GAL4_TRICO